MSRLADLGRQDVNDDAEQAAALDGSDDQIHLRRPVAVGDAVRLEMRRCLR